MRPGAWSCRPTPSSASATGSSGRRRGAALGLTAIGHPLLSTRSAAWRAGDEWLFTGRLSLATHPWLADHAVGERVLLPGTAFAELALAAARHVGAGDVEELTLVAPLVLDRRGAVQVQVVVKEPDEDGRRALEIYSRRDEQAGEEADWVLHAAGLLGAGALASATRRSRGLRRGELAAGRAPRRSTWRGLYERLAESATTTGRRSRGCVRAFRRGDEWYAEVALADEQDGGQAASFRLHPGARRRGLAHAVARARPTSAADAARCRSRSRACGCDGEGCSALRVRVDAARRRRRGPRCWRSTSTARRRSRSKRSRLRPVDRAALRGAGSRRRRVAVRAGVDAGRVRRRGRLAAARGAPGHRRLGASPTSLERYPDLAALEELVATGAPAPDVLLAVAGAGAGGRRDRGRLRTQTAARTLALLQARLRSARWRRRGWCS